MRSIDRSGDVSSAFDDHLQSFNGILSLLFGLFGRI